MAHHCGWERAANQASWPRTSKVVTSRHLRRDKESMNTHEPPELTEETRTVATYIAMVVRNAMEDFHCEHLSDGQMKELNPIIRNAIGTALHAFNNYQQVDAAKRFMDYNLRMVPSYWEPPTLQDGYVRMWERDSNG